MNLHNLHNSTTEFEHNKAQYFTVFGLHLYFYWTMLWQSKLKMAIIGPRPVIQINVLTAKRK